MDFLTSIWLDEVGRWPLAGPVSVGGVFCMPNFWNNLPDRYDQVTDSKKLSSWHRSYLAELILSHPDILVSIHSCTAKLIDRYGIVYAIRKASLKVLQDIMKQLSELWYADEIKIIVDGKTDYGLRNELFSNNWLPRYRSQWQWNVIITWLETLVKGDSLVRQISAASIIAKVQRDNYMTILSKKKKYHCYGFDRHKWYGTVLHRSMILQYGLSDIHRKSFCRNIIIPS